MSIIGDSFTTGTSQGGLGGSNWTRQLFAELENDGVVVACAISAQSAAGYTVRGADGKTFVDQVRETVTPQDELVIIFGGRNDRLEDDTAGATAAFAEVRKIAPDATLMVVGPPWRDGSPPRNVLALRDSIREPALATGATWIDPIEENWFGRGNEVLIGPDNVHPTDPGHKLMASKVVDRVRDALLATPPGGAK